MKKMLCLILCLTLFAFCGCNYSTSEKLKEDSQVEFLSNDEQDLKTITALESVKTGWFNLKGFYQGWLASSLQKTLVSFEIESGIDCYYALYVLGGSDDYSTAVSNCAGEGYVDGYNFFLSKTQGSQIEKLWVKYSSVNEVLPTVTKDGKTYDLDLCMAKKTVNQLIGALNGEILQNSAGVYARYPLKWSGEELVEPNPSECYDSYGADQEVCSLNGKFISVFPNSLSDSLFIGELICDEFFFEIKAGSQDQEYLYRKVYAESFTAESARELFLESGGFSDQEKVALNSVFVDLDGLGMAIDFQVLKDYQISHVKN